MGVQLPPLAPPLPAQVAACSVRQYPVAMADRPDLSALKIDEHARRGPQRHGRRVLVILTVGLLALGGTGYALLREQVPEVQTAIVRADKGGRPALLNASGYVTPRRRGRQDHRARERDLRGGGDARRSGPDPRAP